MAITLDNHEYPARLVENPTPVERLEYAMFEVLEEIRSAQAALNVAKKRQETFEAKIASLEGMKADIVHAINTLNNSA